MTLPSSCPWWTPSPRCAVGPDGLAENRRLSKAIAVTTPSRIGTSCTDAESRRNSRSVARRTAVVSAGLAGSLNARWPGCIDSVGSTFATNGVPASITRSSPWGARSFVGTFSSTSCSFETHSKCVRVLSEIADGAPHGRARSRSRHSLIEPRKRSFGRLLYRISGISQETWGFRGGNRHCVSFPGEAHDGRRVL